MPGREAGNLQKSLRTNIFILQDLPADCLVLVSVGGSHLLLPVSVALTVSST